MTRFVDVPTLSRMVNTIGPENFLRGLAQTMTADFKRWEEFDKSARVASHSDVGVIEIMPIADSKRYGFKYVNGHPANPARGVSTVMAFGALADVDTGYPVLLSELTLTTAFRTAVATAIATRALARPDASVMAMIGCGAQSEFQALAFHTLNHINEIRIFDIDSTAMDKLARHMQAYPELRIIKAPSAEEAVRGVDVVTTCTADKTWATILTPDMVEPGMHINGIGGDCPGKTELHADVLRSGKIFVEFEPQTRVEGDIQQLSDSHPVHDLWRALSSPAGGRDNRDQITIFDSVGFALEDFSALSYVHRMALELDEGEEIALIPELDDPKDLFQRVIDNEGVSKARRAA